MEKFHAMKKKPLIPVRPPLHDYLAANGRLAELPLQYDDMVRFTASAPLRDHRGEHTLWETVYYDEHERDFIFRGLTIIYALLRMDGDLSATEHLEVARVDYCTFGNTLPFRVRIINRLNDNYDHFYLKQTDASRIYGLELEELLSPNHILYLVDGRTLIEEHVAGIPGDDFFRDNLEDIPFNQIRMAKEFVKFNERCFVRLLGDMRAYNYVVDITPDIEGNQYRLRAIDFDQQSYEGRKSFYLPQYFTENNPIIFQGIRFLTHETVKQYQLEERSLIAARIKAGRARVAELLTVMAADELSTPEKIEQLKAELAQHHGSDRFDRCRTMGEVLQAHLALLLEKDFVRSVGSLP